LNLKLRFFLIEWHRRLGVVVALFVVLFVSTGIAINHANALKLDHYSLRNSGLLSWYGLKPKPPKNGYLMGDHWLVQFSGQLLLNDQPLGACDGRLKGVEQIDGIVVALCGSELQLYTAEGDLIEVVGGMPDDLKGLAVTADNNLVLRKEMSGDVFDLDALIVNRATSDGDQLQWQESQRLPADYTDNILSEALLSTGVSIERLLLDIHSGRFWGGWGVYVMDIIALLIGFLALSGVCLWVVRRNGR